MEIGKKKKKLTKAEEEGYVGYVYPQDEDYLDYEEQKEYTLAQASMYKWFFYFVNFISLLLFLSYFTKKEIEQTIIPLLDKPGSLIRADTKSIVYHNYSFAMTVKDLTIFPDSEYFKIHSDEVTFSFRPIFNSFTSSSPADGFTIGDGDYKLKIKTQHSDINPFQNPIFSLSIKRGNLDMDLNHLEMYSAKDDKLVGKIERFFMKCNDDKGEDSHSLGIQLWLEKVWFDTKSDYPYFYAQRFLDDAYKHGMDLNRNELFFVDRAYNLVDATGPFNYIFNLNFRLPNYNFDRVMNIVKKNDNPLAGIINAYRDFDFDGINYSFNMDHRYLNGEMKSNDSIRIHRDSAGILSSTINSNTIKKFQNKYNYKKANFDKYLLYTMARKASLYLGYDLARDFNITVNDFEYAGEALKGIDKAEIGFRHDFDNPATRNSGKIYAYIANDAGISFGGKSVYGKYEGELSIEKPWFLLKELNDIYFDGIRPVLAKNPKNADKVKDVDQLITHIQSKGEQVLEALNSEQRLKKYGDCNAIIKFTADEKNKKIEKITVNGKDLNRFLEDNRIVSFVNKIPEYLQEDIADLVTLESFSNPKFQEMIRYLFVGPEIYKYRSEKLSNV